MKGVNREIDTSIPIEFFLDPLHAKLDTSYIEEMAKPMTAEDIAEQRAFLKTLKDREFAEQIEALLDKIEGERDE